MYPLLNQIFDGGHAHIFFELRGKVRQGKPYVCGNLRDVFLYKADVVEFRQQIAKPNRNNGLLVRPIFIHADKMLAIIDV